MRVRFLDFSQQDIVSVETVLDFFHQLPPSHQRNISVIRYDPARQVASAINRFLEPTIPNRVKGTFYQSDTMNAILIWRFNSVSEFRHIFYHEVGHHVFKNVLPQHYRDKWFYEVRDFEKTTVSEYACKNAKEDFSECYASWFTKHELLRRCPLRFQYFQSIML